MKRSLKHGGGYLEIDHRDSPGLTAADVAHLPGGGLPVPAGTVLQTDVYQCSHCQRTIVLQAKQDDFKKRGYCPKCDHYVCNTCEAIRVKTGACTPAVKLFDRAQEHAAKYVNEPDHPDAAPAPHLLLTDAPRVTVPSDSRPAVVLTDA